jgi:cyclomaltodextrinase
VNQAPTDLFDQNVATAPGDLPTFMIVERERVTRNQFRHDNTIEPLAPVTGGLVTVTAVAGEAMELERAAILFTTDGLAPSVHSDQVPMERGGTTWDVFRAYVTSWSGTIPGQPADTAIRYRIGGWLAGSDSEVPDVWAQDGQGFWFASEPEKGITTFAYRVEAEAPQAPNWVREGVVYHVFLDRFRSDHPDDSMDRSEANVIHGGTLNGVRRSLDYLQELGVTSLFLSPFHPADTYHRYDGKDYLDVDPVLGSKETLRALTSEGRNRGMSFIMDFVPSHLSWKHPAFLAAQRNRDAPSASWFTFYNWPNEYKCFLGMSKALVSIDTDDEGARRYLIDAALLWMKEYGIDGFRLDHAIGPSMDFWVAFRAALKAKQSDSFTVGEVTDTPDAMRRFRQRLDAIMDFPLARALRSTFALQTSSLIQFDAFLNSYDRFMADGPFLLSFLDNHDMDRFLFLAEQDVERLKMAAIVQFALAATPIIYYGTEIGMTHTEPISNRNAGGDSLARQDMIWDESRWDSGVFDVYRSLIHLRRARVALREGSRRTLHVEENSYVFARTSAAGETVLAAVNTGDQDRVLEVAVEFESTPACLVSSAVDTIAGAGSVWQLELPARSAALFGATD